MRRALSGHAIETVYERGWSTLKNGVLQLRERAVDDPARVLLPADACPALVSPDLAARAHARLAVTKAESKGRNPDPLATLWRGFAVCGYCGGRLQTAKASWKRADTPRRYRCARIRSDGDATGNIGSASGGRLSCPGGAYTIAANILDPAGWADVVAWLSDEENVARLLADWQDERQSTEHSISTRLDAADAQLATLRAKMTALAEAIGETTARESRQVLQEKLDEYAGQVSREMGKRERLLAEAADAGAYTMAAQDVRAWVTAVAREAASFTREEQREALRALGAEVTVWRADYIHKDGWPQRYKITLHFTGFSRGGQPMVLPPHSPDVAFVTQTTTDRCRSLRAPRESAAERHDVQFATPDHPERYARQALRLIPHVAGQIGQTQTPMAVILPRQI